MIPTALIAPVQFLVDVLEPVLAFFHDSLGFGWGMSIVLLTVCVRALLVPLTFKQMKSMQAMAKVAPQLKALQAKYKDDKQRQQQEVMKFYQENKINPFASCLPLVLQLPFFLGLFYMLRTDLKADICGITGAAPCPDGGPAQFLFVPNLTDNATGGVLVALIVLYVGSQLLSSLFMSVSADRNQRLLMLGLPFVFTVFIINFPAGLIVYWITTNLWTVGQGYVVRKTIGPIRPPADPAGDKGDATVGGGLLASLLGGGGASKATNGKGASNGAGKANGDVGAATAPKKKARKPVAAAAGPARPSGPPPRSPRKKKKRSGRRR